MKNINTALSWIRVVLFATITAAFYYVKQFLGTQLTEGAATVFAIVVLIFLFKIAAGLADLAVARSRITRRILAGKHFVEGPWIHTVVDEDGQPVSVGLVRIDYDSETLLVSGEAWGRDGLLSNFTSETSFYGDYMLTFTYGQFGTLDQSKGHETGLVGIGKYRFTPQGQRPPDFCTGFFFDGAGQRFYRLTGRRFRAQRDFPSEETEKRKLVHENLLSMEERMPASSSSPTKPRSGKDAEGEEHATASPVI